jgi:hypothetical protein
METILLFIAGFVSAYHIGLSRGYGNGWDGAIVHITGGFKPTNTLVIRGGEGKEYKISSTRLFH